MSFVHAFHIIFNFLYVFFRKFNRSQVSLTILSSRVSIKGIEITVWKIARLVCLIMKAFKRRVLLIFLFFGLVLIVFLIRGANVIFLILLITVIGKIEPLNKILWIHLIIIDITMTGGFFFLYRRVVWCLWIRTSLRIFPWIKIISISLSLRFCLNWAILLFNVAFLLLMIHVLLLYLIIPLIFRILRYRVLFFKLLSLICSFIVVVNLILWPIRLSIRFGFLVIAFHTARLFMLILICIIFLWIILTTVAVWRMLVFIGRHSNHLYQI